MSSWASHWTQRKSHFPPGNATAALLVLSFIHLQVQWEGVKSLPCSSPDLLGTDQSFKGFSCRKLMFESFLRPLLSKLETPLCPVPRAWLVLTQHLRTPQISARSARCWWWYLMATPLCREHPKYADLGVFLYVFFKLRHWPAEC